MLPKTEILYGIHPVLEAFNAKQRVLFEIYFAKEKLSKSHKLIESAAVSLKIPVTKVKASFLESLTKTTRHQGVAAKVSLYHFSDSFEIINSQKASGRKHFLLLLDNIQDSHNLGAIARTALCAGVDGIVITKDRSAGPTPAACKASSGALEHLPVAKVTNMVKFIKELKKKEFWIIGMDGEAEQSVFAVDMSPNIAIIIGSEEKGIRPLVKKECDYLISIPQSGQIDSLNASVAGAIVIYEALRQRNQL